MAGVAERIELFGGQGWSLAGVHDSATGGYRVPWPTAADIPSLAFDPGRWSEELLSGPDPATAEGYQPQQDRPGYNNYAAFGSAHSGGLNMAFCDGSVQTVSYDVDPWVHRNLANRMDGEVTSDTN